MSKLTGKVSVLFPGMATPIPAQPQFIVPAPSPQFMQGGGSDQSTG